MELSIQERLKDLRVEHGLTLEQLAATRHAPRSFGTFCPEVRLLAVLPQPGYSFSDGHSVFKVLSIDELL